MCLIQGFGWLLTPGALWRFGYKSSPRHLEHTLHFKLQCNVLNRLGYQHPSDIQPFDCTTFVWEVLTVQCMVMSCAFFWPRHSPYSNYLCCSYDKAAIGTIFNIFHYDAVSDQDLNLSPSRWQADALRFEPRSRVINYRVNILFELGLYPEYPMWPVWTCGCLPAYFLSSWSL